MKQKQSSINLQYQTKTKNIKDLYSEINILYRNKKIYQINKIPKSVQTENNVNLDEKMKSLRKIFNHKNHVNIIAKEEKIFSELNEISKPIIKTRKDGKTILIETSEIRKAQKFMELYITLKRKDLSKNERIEFILKLKHVLESIEELDMTKIIINLLNRELIMLEEVQLTNDQIKILRKRIEIELLKIMKQPEINPAIKRILKTNPVNIYKCYNCKNLESLKRFVIDFKLPKITTCKYCKYINCDAN